jgi:Ca-activated chloride channel family protein
MRPTLDSPALLSLAVILPLVAIALFVTAYRRRRARLDRLGSATVVSRLLPPAVLGTPRSRSVLLALAALCVGVAMAGPRWGVERTRVTGSGIDLVLALDASLSMMANDVRPNRLEVVKQEVRRLRALSGTDRVGLIAFAGRSYILSPLTVDDGAIELFLDNLDPSIVGQAGSSLSRAIRQGTDLLLATQGASDRALVVMSDGEAFEPVEDVEEAAERAGDQGISVVTVGIGTERGSTIPIEENGRITEKRDENGAIVVTKYTPELLQAAAEASGGTFIPADETDKAAKIRSALSTLKAQQRSVDVGREQSPRFQLFLIPALVCLIIDTLLGERRGRRSRAPAAAEPATTTAAGLALVLVLSSPIPVEARAIQDPAAAYEGERYTEAAAEYRRLIRDGDERDETLYNLGTSLLAADSIDAAIDALDRASRSRSEEVRYRAQFNLGLAHLVRGLATEGPDGEQALDAALAAYKNVLIMRSADGDAKWNYELALRKRQSGGGGGGGADESPSQSAEQDPRAPPTPAERPAGGLGEQQAEQILNSAARDERDVQERRREKSQPPRPRVGKDW